MIILTASFCVSVFAVSPDVLKEKASKAVVGFVKKAEPGFSGDEIEVFVSSAPEGNPYNVGDSEHFRLEHRMCAADGSWIWVLTRGLAVRGPDGRPSRMAGSQSDITARKTAEAKLQHDALHDDLTGLANRVLFMDRLSCALADYERDPKHQFAVLRARCYHHAQRLPRRHRQDQIQRRRQQRQTIVALGRRQGERHVGQRDRRQFGLQPRRQTVPS